MVKAVFLDRDGVINELIYYPEQGVVDSPFTVEQLRLLPGVGVAINKFHEMGYKVILVSNQPGIAKGFISAETFDSIRDKMKEELAKEGSSLDGEYYCFHHSQAKVDELKANCNCRKPKPGLLLQAARDMDIDLVYKIIYQIPKGIIIHFHSNGEPLLYNELFSVLSWSYKQIRHFDTNGKLLLERINDIIDNCECITISTFPNDSEADIKFEDVKEFLEIKGDR